MSADEWNGLRVGDIVIERRSKSPRIVLGVHSRKHHRTSRYAGQQHVVITMRMLHLGSWRAKRGCLLTVLHPADWRPRLDVAHGRRARVTADMQTCCPKHGNVCGPATEGGKP